MYVESSIDQSHGGTIWIDRAKRFDLDNGTCTNKAVGYRCDCTVDA